MTEPVIKEQSSTGLAINLASFLCYLLTFVTGIIIFVLETRSRTVKFHALQSVLLFTSLFIINFILGFIPIINVFTGFVIGLGSFILWILLMVTAYQGKELKLPVISDLTEQLLNKK